MQVTIDISNLLITLCNQLKMERKMLHEVISDYFPLFAQGNKIFLAGPPPLSSFSGYLLLLLCFICYLLFYDRGLE